MSGVIDRDGTQWEHCNGCAKLVRINDLWFGKIRPELIEPRQRQIDAWVAEADASPMIKCDLCDGTGTRADGLERFGPAWVAWSHGCNGCFGTGQRHSIGPRSSGPELTSDEMLELCSECINPQEKMDD
jgi:hypothetical protein